MVHGVIIDVQVVHSPGSMPVRAQHNQLGSNSTLTNLGSYHRLDVAHASVRQTHCRQAVVQVRLQSPELRLD